MGRVGEYARMLDIVSAVEEGRIESALFRLIPALGLLIGTTADIFLALFRTAVE